MKKIKEEHLKDIDFRTHAVRQSQSLEDFKSWYEELAVVEKTERIQGQITILSSVLWYLMDPKEYKKFMKVKR